MRFFQKIAEGIDTAPAIAQLNAHSELWNAHLGRAYEASPHYGVQDIWVRYRKLEEIQADPRKAIEPHWAEFYPCWQRLSALHPIVFGLMARVQATYLGGILITKIPPGGRVKPHDDRGSWHAETMNCKVYVPLQANDGCVNYCGDESLIIRTGEAVIFNNLVTHSVENNGDADRITLICCYKVEN
jgi:hypothetical protein